MKEYIENNLKTKFLGKNIDYYESIDSTHLLAKKIPNKELKDGMLILADNQTEGIGTHERKWFTGKGENLSFNIILTPNCDINKISQLTIKSAECIVTILKKYNIETTIKKPNDIILNNKKMAGILTECVTRKDIVKTIYIGIGININQTEFPGNLTNIATSLKKEFNKEFCREEILVQFLEEFEKEYLEMIKGV